MQESDQSLQRQVLLNIIPRLVISSDTDISHQIQILHEVSPMIFVLIITSLTLHQDAFFIQLWKGSILRLYVRGDTWENLHFSLIFSEFEFVSCYMLLDIEFRTTRHYRSYCFDQFSSLSLILMVKVCENCALILCDSPFFAKA